MTASHPTARRFAAKVLRTGTAPHARNLAAAYLEIRAELDAIQRQASTLLRRRSQRKRRRLERAERERAAREARAGASRVEIALAELRRVNRERRAA